MKKYETYKDSGAEWIGEIPESWKSVNLKWISNITKGRKPKVDYDQNGENLLPYLSMEFLRGKTSNPTYASIEEKGLVHIDDGDILILWDGSKAGEIVKAKKGVLSSTMAKIEINDNNFESNYLNYLLQLGESHVQEHTIGMGIPHVSGDILKMLPMLVPSSQEQTQIANYLDYKTGLIDSIIAQKEELIKKLKEQRQAIINEAVTKGLNPDVKLKDSGIEWLGEIPEHWEVTRLFTLCHLVRGNSNFKKDELLNNGKYVALQYGKTYKVEEVNEEFEYYVNEEFYKDSQVVNYGDTIIISTSETIEDLGHSAFYKRKDIGLLGGEQMLLKTNGNKITPEYLFYSSKVFLKELRKYATGIKVFRFNIDDLKNTYTTVPTINEQTQIVDFIESKSYNIKNAIIGTETSIKKLKEYRQSLISEAVTGKVDVRDWQVPKS